MDKIKTGNKKWFLMIVGILFLILGMWIFENKNWLFRQEKVDFVLLKKLVKIEPLPVNAHPSLSRSNDIIYVLGSSPKILKNRFKTASDLYKNRLALKIMIDSQAFIMDFSPALGRNRTFNEWAIEKLTGLGVNKEDIEFVTCDKGFFGTFSEAKGISEIVIKREYSSLILVTSSYHTKRAWITFSNKLRNQKIRLFIYGSEDKPNIPSLFLEYFKLKFYQIFLL